MTCKCGCGRPVYYRKRIAHDCPTKVTNRLAYRRKAVAKRTARRTASRLAKGQPRWTGPDAPDLSPEDIERKFSEALQYLKAKRRAA